VFLHTCFSYLIDSINSLIILNHKINLVGPNPLDRIKCVRRGEQLSGERIAQN